MMAKKLNALEAKNLDAVVGALVAGVLSGDREVRLLPAQCSLLLRTLNVDVTYSRPRPHTGTAQYREVGL
jgi:hypothetical protein